MDGHGRTWTWTDGRTSMDCYKNKQGIRRSPCSKNWYINYFNVSGFDAIIFLCLLITALCYYDGGSLALLFLMGCSLNYSRHGQEHGQPINEASFSLKVGIL